MARIAGVNIPANKRLVISLTYIYGIGLPSAQKICKDAGISESKRVKDLVDQELITLRSLIEKNYQVEGDLRREVSLNIKKKKDESGKEKNLKRVKNEWMNEKNKVNSIFIYNTKMDYTV